MRKHLVVEQACGKLGHSAWATLVELGDKPLPHPAETMGNVLGPIATINQLLDMGLIEMRFRKVDVTEIIARPALLKEPLTEYHITPFGRAVRAKLLSRLQQNNLNTEESAQIKKLVSEQFGGSAGPN